MQNAARSTLFRIALVVLLATGSVGLNTGAALAGHLVDVNLTEDGLALNGYDPVAYFTDGRPVLGKSTFEYELDGVTYRFAREDTRQRFIADPHRYMPAYGGFCAYGVRTGRKFEIDPNAWRIVEDRLYLLLNPATKAIWDLERAGNIEIANAIWPKIRPYTDAELERRAP
ncbi:MAG: YHS domain-containing (seleno)protein [Thalassobaculaceae bacterium]|nr:YHS domain-containing (seleno)protein [Thalassobaculaceae bacterium]